VSTEIGGVSGTLTPPNVNAALVQSQVVPSLPGIVGPTIPTAAVSGQMPVPVSQVSVTVPTPSVGTTAIISAPAVVTISPPVVATTVVSVAPISHGVASDLSSIAVTQPINTAPAVVPSSTSSASSLPVGMGTSLSSSSSSQPAYYLWLSLIPPSWCVHTMVPLVGPAFEIILGVWLR